MTGRVDSGPGNSMETLPILLQILSSGADTLDVLSSSIQPTTVADRPSSSVTSLRTSLPLLDAIPTTAHRRLVESNERKGVLNPEFTLLFTTIKMTSILGPSRTTLLVHNRGPKDFQVTDRQYTGYMTI